MPMIKSRAPVRKTTNAVDVDKKNEKRKLEQEEVQSEVVLVIRKQNKRKRKEQEIKVPKVVVKKTKLGKRREQESSAGNEEDRLSSLPESLRLHILSSLDAKKAVQTSALSKSFKSSWASIPVLNFHSHNCFNRGQLRVFDKFVDKVLSKRDTSVSLQRLSFVRGGSCSARMLKSVFGYVLSHGVKEFKAEIDASRKRAWPDFLNSTADSLTSLTLTSHYCHLDCLFLGPRESVFFFKNLSVLCLKKGIIKCLEPFSGFPVLEKLTLINCRVETDGNTLNINALNLSELTLDCDEIPVCLNLTTPKLKFFEFRSYSFQLLFKTHTALPILNTVVLGFPGIITHTDDNQKMEDLLCMLRAVHIVKTSAVFASVVVMQLSLFKDSSLYPFQKLKQDLTHNLDHDENFLDNTCRWLRESLDRPRIDHSCSVIMRRI